MDNPGVSLRTGESIDPIDPSAESPVSSFVLAGTRFDVYRPVNAMSVDVEDYFQVSAFDGQIKRQDWASMPLRVSHNVHKILQLFDDAGARATFFTLGWIAEKQPELVKLIADQGHEVASHGCNHDRVTAQSPEQFRDDVSRSKAMLEELTGSAVTGYRAPSFSIGEESLWAHDILQDAGYRYSSSVFPINHDHYGLPMAPRFPFRQTDDHILEIPMTSLRMGGRNWPCAGGGFFRLLPYAYFRWALQRVNHAEKMPAVFYFHPWEIDPHQPRIDGISWKSRFRHYVNLSRFEGRLQKLLRDFNWDRMDRVYGDAG